MASKNDGPGPAELERKFDNFDSQVNTIRTKTAISEYTNLLKGIAKELLSFYESQESKEPKEPKERQLLFESKSGHHSIFLATFWGLLHKLVFELKNYDIADQKTPFKLFLGSKYVSGAHKVSKILHELSEGVANIVKTIKAADKKEYPENTKLYIITNAKDRDVCFLM